MPVSPESRSALRHWRRQGNWRGSTRSFVLDHQKYRLLKSLSNLAGVDLHIHSGSPMLAHQVFLLLSARYAQIRGSWGWAFDAFCFTRLVYLANSYLHNLHNAMRERQRKGEQA